MRRLFTAFILLIVTGCMKTDYGFERIEGEQSVSLPLKFDSSYGVRDGESVKAEARFGDGHHGVGRCSQPPASKLWTFRWEYFCPVCREYAWGGSKVGAHMAAK